MAHNLYKNTMAFAGETPWHGLGVKLPANATWDVMSRAAGFYDVREEAVRLANGRIIPGRKALVRTDTGAPLAVVSENYGVVQFSEVAETLVAAAKGTGAIFHTAGLLGEDGSRGWLLAELPKTIKVKGDKSEIRPYLLGTAAHDGRNGVVLKNVATRVVCQNTLGVAMGEKDSRWYASIYHTKNAVQRLAEAREAFAAMLEGMDAFEVMANQLAAAKFTEKMLAATLDDLLPLPKGDATESAGVAAATTRITERRERVQTLFEAGMGINASIRGTAWAAFQAWTEYADHHRVVRGDDNGAKKLESVWLGRSAEMKTDALASIVRQINA
ncbi:MAG: DUF932 domain-containing protein [Myxococcota bacterium]